MKKRVLVLAAGLILAALYLAIRKPAKEPAGAAVAAPRSAAPASGRVASDAVEPVGASAATTPRAAPAAETPAETYAEHNARVTREIAADPVAAQVPMLFEFTKEQQLETLRWLLHVPGDKLASAVPGAGNDASLPPEVKRQRAVDIVSGLIRDLEKEGIQAPTLPDDFVAAGTERIEKSDEQRRWEEREERARAEARSKIAAAAASR